MFELGFRFGCANEERYLDVKRNTTVFWKVSQAKEIHLNIDHTMTNRWCSTNKWLWQMSNRYWSNTCSLWLFFIFYFIHKTSLSHLRLLNESRFFALQSASIKCRRLHRMRWNSIQVRKRFAFQTAFVISRFIVPVFKSKSFWALDTSMLTET